MLDGSNKAEKERKNQIQKHIQKESAARNVVEGNYSGDLLQTFTPPPPH